jgi:uncharacterized protein YcbK (DUF882 family)
MFVVCERVRKAAATERQPQRAERAMSLGVSQHALSSASDDDVGGVKQSAMRQQHTKIRLGGHGGPHWCRGGGQHQR